MSGACWIWVRPTSGISGIHTPLTHVPAAHVCLLCVSASCACPQRGKDQSTERVVKANRIDLTHV